MDFLVTIVQDKTPIHTKTITADFADKLAADWAMDLGFNINMMSTMGNKITIYV